MSRHVADVLRPFSRRWLALEPDERQRVFDLAAELITRWHNDRIQAGLSPAEALRAYCLGHGLSAELADIVAFPARKAFRDPVVEDGRVFARYPHFRDQAGIPDSCFEITRQIRLKHDIRRLDVVDGVLHISGEAYLNYLGGSTEIVLRRWPWGPELRFRNRSVRTPHLRAARWTTATPASQSTSRWVPRRGSAAAARRLGDLPRRWPRPGAAGGAVAAREADARRAQASVAGGHGDCALPAETRAGAPPDRRRGSGHRLVGAGRSGAAPRTPMAPSGRPVGFRPCSTCSSSPGCTSCCGRGSISRSACGTGTAWRSPPARPSGSTPGTRSPPSCATRFICSGRPATSTSAAPTRWRRRADSRSTSPSSTACTCSSSPSATSSTPSGTARRAA